MLGEQQLRVPAMWTACAMPCPLLASQFQNPSLGNSSLTLKLCSCSGLFGKQGLALGAGGLQKTNGLELHRDALCPGMELCRGCPCRRALPPWGPLARGDHRAPSAIIVAHGAAGRGYLCSSCSTAQGKAGKPVRADGREGGSNGGNEPRIAVSRESWGSDLCWGTSQPPTPTSQPRGPQVPIMGTEGVQSQNSHPLHPFHVASPWRRAELLPAWMECRSHGPSSEQRGNGGKSSPLIPIPALHPSLPNQTKRASPSLPDAAPPPSPGPPHLAQVRPASRGCWRRSRGTGGPAASRREERCARALGTGCHQRRSIPSSPHASSTPDCLR